MTGLTDVDRDVIARARKLAAASGDGAVSEHTGETDPVMAYARAFGAARHLLAELAAIAERISGGEDEAAGPGEDTRPTVREAARRGARKAAALAAAETEDTRRLAAIRDVLRHFDWEYHDRQLALKAIERIVEGGQA